MARTFWMRVFAAAYWVLVAILAYLLAIFVLPDLGNPEVAPFLYVFGVFLAFFLAVALAATLWRRAPERPWLWAVGTLPAVALLALNAPYLPYSLTHPGDVQGFTAAWPLLAATIVVVVAGYLSFREARAGAGAANPTPRAAMGLTILVAAVLGAIATSFLGAGGGGGATAAEVDSTTVVEARDVTFVQDSLTATSGETLGVVVVNRDSFAHSFDIDELNVHVQVPANASTLVAVTPAAAGSLKFYCGVPGHEAAMQGTIEVK